MNELRSITEFPAVLEAGDEFTFTHEGATYHAKALFRHVFYEADALADHLSRTARGLYDGLELVPAARQEAE